MITAFRSLLTVLMLVAFVPSPAEAQNDASMIVSGGFHLGFGGEVHVENDLIDADADLDATVGLNLRVEIPIADFIRIGGMFAWSALKADGADDRTHILDFDLLVRALIGFELGDMDAAASLGVPIGLTLSILNDDLRFGGLVNKAGVGFNVGLLAMFELFFTDAIGAYLELGWALHMAFHGVDGGDGIKTRANQGQFGLGALFAF